MNKKRMLGNRIAVMIGAIILAVLLFGNRVFAADSWEYYEGSNSWFYEASSIALNQNITIQVPATESYSHISYYGEVTFAQNGYMSIKLNNNTDFGLDAGLMYPGGAAAMWADHDVYAEAHSSEEIKEIYIERGTYSFVISTLVTPTWTSAASMTFTIGFSTTKGGTPTPTEPKKPTVKAGWKNEGSNWYYVKEDGTKATGWIKVDGKWYYLRPSTGAMLTKWQKIDGKWYYLGKDGAMQKGWKKLSGKWYYLNGGVMTIGWKRIDGSWYYFDGAGVMKKDWQKIDGKWFYLKGGAMVTGKQKIAGKWYTFDKNGVWKQ